MKVSKNYNIEWGEYFEYSGNSPSGLVWKICAGLKSCPTKEGSVAGSLSSNKKYWSVKCGGVSYLTHRIVFVLNFGSIPEGYVVDHIDRNTCNNRKDNLRAVPPEVNTRNQKTRKGNKTGHNGVTLCEKELRYKVYWQDYEGRSRSKAFSFRNTTKESALEEAILFRGKMIDSLNNFHNFGYIL